MNWKDKLKVAIGYRLAKFQRKFWVKLPPQPDQCCAKIAEAPDFEGIARRDLLRMCAKIGVEPGRDGYKPLGFEGPTAEFVSLHVCVKQGFDYFRNMWNVAEDRLVAWRKVNPRVRAYLVVLRHLDTIEFQIRGHAPTVL